MSPTTLQTVPTARGALTTGAVGAFLLAASTMLLAFIFLTRGRGSEVLLVTYAGLGLVSAILLAVGCFAAARPYGGGQITAGVFAILAGLGAAGTFLIPTLVRFNSMGDAAIVALASSSGTAFLFAIFAAIANQRNTRGHQSLGVLTASSYIYYAAVLGTALGLKFALSENMKAFLMVSLVASLVMAAAMICHGIGLLQMKNLKVAAPAPEADSTPA